MEVFSQFEQQFQEIHPWHQMGADQALGASAEISILTFGAVYTAVILSLLMINQRVN